MGRVNVKRVRVLFGYCPLVILLFLFVRSVEAATFCVSTEAELWLALLDARENDAEDTVCIVEGKYTGSFAYSSEENYGLAITGGYEPGCPPKNSTPSASVLDGDGAGPVLILNSTRAVDFVVRDLVLQNGKTTSNPNGGGLYVFTDGGSVTIERSTITNNAADDNGGGIYLRDCSTASLASNTIAYNNAADQGGGIFVLSYGATVSLTDNTIINNRSRWGGGAYISRTDAASLAGNNIVDNNSQWSGGGVTLFDNSVSILTKNIIDNNIASIGAGVYLYAFRTGIMTNNIITNNKNNGLLANCSYMDSPFAFINNTITGNEADYEGSGIKLTLTSDNDSANIYNNIFWKNIGIQGADLHIDNDGDNNYFYSSVNLFNNDFDQSKQGFYIEDPNFHIKIDSSNLNKIDPQFISPTSDNYHLRGYSPCVDAGDNQAPELPTTDKDGRDRIVNSSVDLGAYEYQASEVNYMPGVQLLLLED